MVNFQKKNKSNVENMWAGLDEIIVKPSSSKYWQQKPVKTEEFLLSKKYMNLKGIIWPSSIEAVINLDKSSVRQAALIWGMGSGKSFVVSCLQARLVYLALCLDNPQTYYGLAPDERVFFINMATNRYQAENVVFAGIVARLRNSPWFQEVNYEPFTTEIVFPKNLYVMCGNSRAYGWHGFHILGGILDEACKFMDRDDKPIGERIWNALETSGRTRFPDYYKTIAISSPLWEDDFGMRKYKDLKYEMDEGNKTVYAECAPTWKKSPKVTFESLKEDFRRNPEVAWRDYGARPPTADNPYFGDPDILVRNADRSIVNPTNSDGSFHKDFKPKPGASYYIHVDLGAVHDRCALAMVHVDGELDDPNNPRPIVKVDLMDVWEAPPQGAIKFSEVRNRIIYLRDTLGFPIEKVTFDRWQSIDSQQLLEDEGFTVDLIGIDRTSEYHDTLKEAIMEKRVKYFPHPIFIKEAKTLRLVRGTKIDHMPGGSKDLWDAVAGAVGSAILEADMGSSVYAIY